MRIEILCPVCKSNGLHRCLQLADDKATGMIYPYCKYCKKNIPVRLDGNGHYALDGEPFRFEKAN